MSIVNCPQCGAKNRVNEEAARNNLQPVCGKCGARLSASNSGKGSNATTARPQKPIDVTDATFSREVLGVEGVPVLLDCWAPWCGPCRMVAPVLDNLAASSDGRYVIAKLNVDDNPRTSSQFGIQSIPTLLIIKNGALVDRMVGIQPQQAITARLAAHA